MSTTENEVEKPGDSEETTPKVEEIVEEVTGIVEPAEGDVEAETEGGDDDETDAEIEAMKRRVKEMEAEAAKIEAFQSSVEKNLKPAAPTGGPDVDSRSIYVGSVDYSTTPEELKDFFNSCGTVNRVTIICDKFSGHPKGFAYVEFKEADAIVNAMILNETVFKGRALKISPKRTNIPGFNRRGRGRRRRGGYGGGGYGGYGRRRYRRRASYHPYY